MIDFIIIIILAAVVGLAVWQIIKRKKSGGGCGCGCSSCSKADLCHPAVKK